MKALIIALQKDGKIVSATYELIEAAKNMGGGAVEISTVVLADNAEALAKEIAARGEIGRASCRERV